MRRILGERTISDKQLRKTLKRMALRDEFSVQIVSLLTTGVVIQGRRGRDLKRFAPVDGVVHGLLLGAQRQGHVPRECRLTLNVINSKGAKSIESLTSLAGFVCPQGARKRAIVFHNQSSSGLPRLGELLRSSTTIRIVVVG